MVFFCVASVWTEAFCHVLCLASFQKIVKDTEKLIPGSLSRDF